MCKAVKFYKSSYHTTIKATSLDVQNYKTEHKVIKKRLKAKLKIISKHNTKRENNNYVFKLISANVKIHCSKDIS